jgi:hypothetical protein
VPSKTPLSEAIFNKYQHQQQLADPVIREEDEDELTESAVENLVFRIKNLDTGEEMEIENEEQEELFQLKVSEGIHGTFQAMQTSGT